MSIYSSREPFNDDPEPYVTYADDRRTDVRSKDWDIQSSGDVEYVRVYDPRTEYNRPQNNPTNPILVDIRRNLWRGASWTKILKHYNWVTFSAAHYITEDWESITDEDQIDHARKVLTRLAALEKMEPRYVASDLRSSHLVKEYEAARERAKYYMTPNEEES